MGFSVAELRIRISATCQESSRSTSTNNPPEEYSRILGRGWASQRIPKEGQASEASSKPSGKPQEILGHPWAALKNPKHPRKSQEISRNPWKLQSILENPPASPSISIPGIPPINQHHGIPITIKASSTPHQPPINPQSTPNQPLINPQSTPFTRYLHSSTLSIQTSTISYDYIHMIRWIQPS